MIKKVIQKGKAGLSLLRKRNFNKWLTYYEYRKRKTHLISFPHTFDIENTAFCNLHCIMRPYDEITREKGNMDFGLFKKIIYEIKDYAVLAGLPVFGEPLIDKDIVEKVKFAKRCGIPRFHISTNATLLDTRVSKEIINSGLDTIILGLDAAGKETYEKVRRGGDYEAVCKNIEEFLELKKHGKPHTTLQMIDFSMTHHEVGSFKQKWGKNEYIDEILVKRLSSWPLSQTNPISTEIDYFKYGIRAERKPCLTLWNSLVIYWNGDVSPCCRDWNGECILGNMKNETIRHIWNNEKMVNLRKLHIQGKFDDIPLCKDCRDWYGA